MSSQQFVLDVNRWADKAAGLIAIVPRKVALELFSRVVMRTPVDEGRARGNWQPSFGSPVAGETDAKDRNGGPTIEAIAKAVESWDVANVAIWLTNNVPYIVPLEDGHSDQAPAGMVKISLAEYPGIVEAMTRESRG